MTYSDVLGNKEADADIGLAEVAIPLPLFGCEAKGGNIAQAAFLAFAAANALVFLKCSFRASCNRHPCQSVCKVWLKVENVSPKHPLDCRVDDGKARPFAQLLDLHPGQKTANH